MLHKVTGVETPVLDTTYTYNSTSAQVTGVQHSSGHYSSSYTYDANGNILTVSDGTYTTSYVYDSANQLVRENNQAGGFTHTWTYDNGGQHPVPPGVCLYHRRAGNTCGYRKLHLRRQ
ncbi:MAG: hypothetical protein J6Q53_01270 [Oscillospiraceae bacterium]|nr:hypothetical protein [Oscillospiraceae bacterium]